MEQCVYRMERLQDDKHRCMMHGACLPKDGTPATPSCDSCKDNLRLKDRKFNRKWKDSLLILDRDRTPTTSLRNLLAGSSAFLICGGPSANDLPLEQLHNRRGLFSLAVNNSAGHRVRPHAFVCADPPSKFSHSIWLDPQVMKFIPTPKLGRRGRSKLKMKKDGVFSELKQRVQDCPNVWGFQRRSWLTPDDGFFLDDGAHWGNHNAGVERTGEPKTVCTFLLGIRLLRYLGAKRIYLVGVDFRMRPDYGYSFNQNRDSGASRSNTDHFIIVNKWLCDMQESGVFKRFGLEVFNCFEKSGLRAFPFFPFEDAIIEAKGDVEDVPDLEGWYEKGKEKKDVPAKK